MFGWSKRRYASISFFASAVSLADVHVMRFMAYWSFVCVSETRSTKENPPVANRFFTENRRLPTSTTRACPPRQSSSPSTCPILSANPSSTSQLPFLSFPCFFFSFFSLLVASSSASSPTFLFQQEAACCSSRTRIWHTQPFGFCGEKICRHPHILSSQSQSSRTKKQNTAAETRDVVLLCFCVVFFVLFLCCFLCCLLCEGRCLFVFFVCRQNLHCLPSLPFPVDTAITSAIHPPIHPIHPSIPRLFVEEQRESAWVSLKNYCATFLAFFPRLASPPPRTVFSLPVPKFPLAFWLSTCCTITASPHS